MTLEQRLAAIQYLANDLQDHIIRGLFLEIAVERLGRKGGPTAQTLELAADLYVGAPLKNGKGNIVGHPPTNLLEHDEAEPRRRGRALPSPASPTATTKNDPRNTMGWVRELTLYAAEHEGVLTLDDYYRTKLVQDYGDGVKIGTLRLAASLNYAYAVLKYFKRTKRKTYELTAKGRAFVESLAQNPPEQSSNEAPKPPVEKQPALFDTSAADVSVSTKSDSPVQDKEGHGLSARMIAYAQSHGGQIHMGDFKAAEKKAGRSGPGGGAYKILKDKFKPTATPGVFDLVAAAAPTHGGKEPPLADAIRAYVAAHGQIDVLAFRKEFAKRWGKRPQAVVNQLKSTLRTLVFAEELRRVKPDVYAKGDGFEKAMAANA